MTTGTSHPNYMCAGNNAGQSKWDIPTVINLNARSLSIEKLDELKATVGIHDVSVVCVSETWFKDYMGKDSLNLYGFNLERKDRKNGRAGGVACYLRTDILYSRLYAYEDDELEVIWIKVMPKRLPRTISCILIACIYYTQQTDYLKMREHIITSIDAVIRKHPDCGIIVTGDFNQLNDNFLKTHYRFVQIVNVDTRGNAVLDKIWTNIDKVYMSPVTISELGTSDHSMVLLKPSSSLPCSTGSVMRVTIWAMGENEKALCHRALSAVSWEPMFRLETCEEQYAYYHTMIDSLMEMCFPYKIVTRHSADKPWVTDGFRLLVRKRQRAHMSGHFEQE